RGVRRSAGRRGVRVAASGGRGLRSPAGRRRGPSAVLGGCIEAVQVVALHQLDELGTVPRGGRINAGQRGGKGIRAMPLRHRVREVLAVREELAVRLDALRGVVIDPERRRGGDETAAGELLGRQEIAARWAGPLDAEQVVILAGQEALAPAG